MQKVKDATAYVVMLTLTMLFVGWTSGCGTTEECDTIETPDGEIIYYDCEDEGE